jgi:hypothetical protein
MTEERIAGPADGCDLVARARGCLVDGVLTVFSLFIGARIPKPNGTCYGWVGLALVIVFF